MYLTENRLVKTGKNGVLQRASDATCMTDGLKLITTVVHAGKLETVLYLNKTRDLDIIFNGRLKNKAESNGILYPVHSLLTSNLSSRNCK